MARLTRWLRNEINLTKRARRNFVVLIASVFAIGFLVVSILAGKIDTNEAQVQRDDAVAETRSLAEQIRQECAAERLRGPICDNAARVQAAPIPGPPGGQGPQGIPGVPGAQGKEGPEGPRGESPPCLATPAQCQGADGADGRDGKDGQDGADGQAGPACPLGWRPVETSGATGTDGTRYGRSITCVDPSSAQPPEEGPG